MRHYEHPANDREELFNLQYDFKHGNQAALGEMYTRLYEIAYKTINRISQECAEVRGLALQERQQKAHDAATYIIEQYLKRPEFEIKDSITGYLFRRVQRELFFARKCDKMLVFTGELTERPVKETAYRYIVTNTATGERRAYNSVNEIYLNPVFKWLKKKRLAECVQSGKTWKTYRFDVLEIAN